MTQTVDPPARTATPRPDKPRYIGRNLILAAILAVVVYVAGVIDARWANLIEVPEALTLYLGLMTQGLTQNPLTEPASGDWLSALRLMIESVHMAWIGTMIGALLSFPLAFLASRNVSPGPVVFATRQVLNSIRAIPELIWALAIMIPIFGLGPLSGTLAIGLHSIGTLGKLTSEVIEGVDRGPIEAARSTGARSTQILRWGVVPQVLPETVAFWLYRFEINIRAGAILGFVGAGGIGTIINQLFNARRWERIGITLVVIILVTVVVDQISSRARRRIISGGDTTVRDDGGQLTETPRIPL